MAHKDNTHIHVMMKKIRDTMNGMHGWGLPTYDSAAHFSTRTRGNARLLERYSTDWRIYCELMMMWKDLQERCNGGHCDWFGRISISEVKTNIFWCEEVMKDLGILGETGNEQNA